MASSTTFHPFSRLPPELRQQVWRHTLPSTKDIRPALFFHRHGLWNDVSKNYRNELWDYNHYIHLDFQDQLLSPVDINIPLAAVNYEANSVAIQWAKKRGFTAYHLQSAGSIIVRNFDPLHDGLYIDHETLANFVSGCENQRYVYDPESLANTEVFGKSRVRHLAIPLEALKARGVSGLVYFLEDYFDQLDELWLMTGPQPKDIQIMTKSEMVQRRWSIEDAIGEEGIIRKIKIGLNSWFSSEATRGLRIRLVRAVLV